MQNSSRCRLPAGRRLTLLAGGILLFGCGNDTPAGEISDFPGSDLPETPPASTPNLDPPPPATGGLEGLSLLGRELISRPDPEGTIAAADSALEEAPEGSPEEVERILTAGLTRAALWQYAGAIQLYDRGIQTDPENPWFYRHRGHRLISLRQFDEAIRDLQYAAALEPYSFDILYHLGLAHYLAGDFQSAARVYHRCMRMGQERETMELELSGALGPGYRSCMLTALNEDAHVALADWLYRALRRAGSDEEAERVLAGIREEMQVDANRPYHRALLYYRGSLAEEEVLPPDGPRDTAYQTRAYGVANWHLMEGDTARAVELLETIAESEEWPSFGVIAAEAELARLPER